MILVDYISPCGLLHSYYEKKVLTVMVCLFVCVMVFNTTFNNISVIPWRSVLLVEGPGENQLSQVFEILYHIMLYASP